MPDQATNPRRIRRVPEPAWSLRADVAGQVFGGVVRYRQHALCLTSRQGNGGLGGNLNNQPSTVVGVSDSDVTDKLTIAEKIQMR